MKCLICLCLSVVLFFLLLGCQGDHNVTHYAFFYPRNDLGYHDQESKFFDRAIETESRNDISSESILQIMAAYLKGPLDPSLYNPFPADLCIMDLDIQGEELYLTVSDHLAQLRDIPLVIACTCMAQTAMPLTNTSTVYISCNSSLLNGEKYIIMKADAIILDDLVVTETNG